MSPTHRPRPLRPLLAPGLALLLLALPGCRCTVPAPSCRLERQPATIPTAAADPRLVALAQAGQQTFAVWLEGQDAEAAVVLSTLDGRGLPVTQARRLGQQGPAPLMAAVGAEGDQLAVLWMGGTTDSAALRGALLRGPQVQALEVAPPGALADPALAFVGARPWAAWASGGAIWARPLQADAAAPPLRLVDGLKDAFWPLLLPLGQEVALAYVQGQSGLGWRLRRAATVEQLAAAPDQAVTEQEPLQRLEPALAAHGGDAVLAWSQVPQGEGAGRHRVHAARMQATRQLARYPRTLPGLGPAVAPGPDGAVAVAWLRPLTGETARLAFGLIAPDSAEPVVLQVDEADLQNGRPAMVLAHDGYTLLWVRRAPQRGQRELRTARVVCGR